MIRWTERKGVPGIEHQPFSKLIAGSEIVSIRIVKYPPSNDSEFLPGYS